MAHRRPAAALVAVLLAVAGCSLDEPDLNGRACPCLPGWTCDEARHVCVREGEGGDGGPRDDAGSSADAGDGDASAPDAGRECGDCDDGISCTRDLCLITGECTNVPDSALCNLGETCDTASGCKRSTCVPPDCDDHDECTADACELATSTCSNEPQCGDLLCCAGGVCGECCEAADCDDSDPCTTDTCTADGCASTDLPEGAPCGLGLACCAGQCAQCCGDADCDDGSDCTDDACVAGACESTSVCGCQDDGDCMGAVCCAGQCRTCCDDPDCDDGDPCTLDSCESGRCLLRETCPGERCCAGVCGECCDPDDCGPPAACEAPATCVGASCDYALEPDGTSCPQGVCCGGACDECCEDEDCPPPDWECNYHACISDVGDHWCEDVPVPDGTECFWEPGACCGGTCCPIGSACVNSECIVVPDELESEPNDDAANANPLADGSRLGALIEPADDQDWYSITLAADDTLQIDTSEACGMDTVVYVYGDPPPDPAPTELRCDEGTPAPALACSDDTANGYCGEITFVAPADGVYYIRVVTFDAEESGPYLLNVWLP